MEFHFAPLQNGGQSQRECSEALGRITYNDTLCKRKNSPGGNFCGWRFLGQSHALWCLEQGRSKLFKLNGNNETVPAQHVPRSHGSGNSRPSNEGCWQVVLLSFIFSIVHYFHLHSRDHQTDCLSYYRGWYAPNSLLNFSCPVWDVVQRQDSWGQLPAFTQIHYPVFHVHMLYFPLVAHRGMWLKNDGCWGSQRKIQGCRLWMEASGHSNGRASFLASECRQVGGVNAYFKGGESFIFQAESLYSLRELFGRKWSPWHMTLMLMGLAASPPLSPQLWKREGWPFLSRPPAHPGLTPTGLDNGRLHKGNYCQNWLLCGLSGPHGRISQIKFGGYNEAGPRRTESGDGPENRSLRLRRRTPAWTMPFICDMTPSLSFSTYKKLGD